MWLVRTILTVEYKLYPTLYLHTVLSMHVIWVSQHWSSQEKEATKHFCDIQWIEDTYNMFFSFRSNIHVITRGNNFSYRNLHAVLYNWQQIERLGGRMATESFTILVVLNQLSLLQQGDLAAQRCSCKFSSHRLWLSVVFQIIRVNHLKSLECHNCKFPSGHSMLLLHQFSSCIHHWTWPSAYLTEIWVQPISHCHKPRANVTCELWCLNWTVVLVIGGQGDAVVSTPSVSGEQTWQWVLADSQGDAYESRLLCCLVT